MGASTRDYFAANASSEDIGVYIPEDYEAALKLYNIVADVDKHDKSRPNKDDILKVLRP